MDCLATRCLDCKYLKIFNNSHTPMVIIEPVTGNIDDVNMAACSYYGYSKEEFVKLNARDINILEEKEVKEKIEAARGRQKRYFQCRHRLFSGEIREVEVHGVPLHLNGRELVLAVIHDVEEKKNLEARYERNKLLFKSLFHNSPEAIAIVDKDFNVLDVNDGFKRVFNYDLYEIESKDITKTLCDDKAYDASYHFRKSIAEGKFVKEEVKRKTKNGILLDVLFLGFPVVTGENILGAYCIYSDIREAKEKEEQIQALKRYDSVTGLLNRDFFLSILDFEILETLDNRESDDKIGIVILNINEFKEVIGALGSSAADDLLRQLTLRLKDTMEAEDAMARFSEGELAILLSDIKDIGELNSMTDKVMTSIEAPFCVENEEMKITISMGISIYPDDGMESSALVRKAELAMNKSKELSGVSPVRFHNSLDKEIQEHFWVKNNLAKALTNKELFLEYQPIYDTDADELIGTEALIRWNNKERGIISPIKFIPTAESTGLIHSIGQWVLINACKQNKAWQDMGYKPVYISVNISALQLEEPDFIEILKNALGESNLDPKYLQLEITETYFAHRYKFVKDVIRRIKNLGIRLAVDDFGTGYSSLGQLCQLDINTIKIDRSLITDVHRELNKNKVVRAVISLAKSLNIDLIAEGVETLEELDFLKKNRCKTAQGFLFSKPVSPGDIENHLV